MSLAVQPGHVLLAMENEADLAAMKARLIELGCRVSAARSGAEALEMACGQSPQVILARSAMSDLGGVELCRRLRADARSQDTPLILLAAAGDSLDRLEAFRAGATDCLTWPADDVELQARLSTALRVRQLQDRPLSPATEDVLTGLLNRASFEEHFGRECNRSRRYDSLFALVLLDIDDFRDINDLYGLGFGDHVLRTVAEILRQQTRESDSLARWGGNEFIVMLPEADLPRAIGFAKKVHAALIRHEFPAGGRTVGLRVSLGLASRQNIGGRDPAEMLRLAQGSLQTAKDAGGNRIAYHTVGEFDLVRM